MVKYIFVCVYVIYIYDNVIGSDKLNFETQEKSRRKKVNKNIGDKRGKFTK